MAGGCLTRDAAKEMLQELLLMLQAATHISSKNFTRGAESHFCIGGYLPDGRDGFCDLSRLILEALIELPTYIPQVTLRWTAKTPREVLRFAMDCERHDPHKRVVSQSRKSIPEAPNDVLSKQVHGLRSVPKKCPNGMENCTLCGRCTLYCPHDAREICGREYTVDEVMRELLKDKTLYENTGGGVTLSGGECLLQIDFLAELLKECKKNGIHTAVDTAGHVLFAVLERILPHTDLFLYDVKCYDSGKHQQYTGVGNALILENLKRLLTMGKAVWVRIPIVPTVNDTAEEMQKIKAFLDTCGTPEKIELLPYHAMGEHKYGALGKVPQAFLVPSEEKMQGLKKIFS